MLSLRQRSETGETLVELLIAIVILGIAGAAILAGMTLNVQASAINRHQAGGSDTARSAAEAIQSAVDASGKYASCADAIDPMKAYTIAANSVINSGDVSNGYTANVLSVESWKGGASGWGACDTNGIQRIKLQVTTPGDASHQAIETLYVVLRQPCSSAGSGAGGALVSGDDPCT